MQKSTATKMSLNDHIKVLIGTYITAMHSYLHVLGFYRAKTLKNWDKEVEMRPLLR